MGSDEIPNYLAVGIQPSSLTEEIEAGRVAMERHLRGKSTVSEWKECAAAHADAIKVLNPMWRVDLHFIQHHAEGALLQELRNRMLKSLPEPEDPTRICVYA